MNKFRELSIGGQTIHFYLPDGWYLDETLATVFGRNRTLQIHFKSEDLEKSGLDIEVIRTRISPKPATISIPGILNIFPSQISGIIDIHFLNLVKYAYICFNDPNDRDQRFNLFNFEAEWEYTIGPDGYDGIMIFKKLKVRNS